MKKKAPFPAMLMIAGVIVVLDHFVKLWFLRHFLLGESRRVFSYLYLTLVHNTGTAFGLFQNNSHALLILAYGILAVLLYAARGLCEHGGRWAFLGVSFVLGGAIGNILDRHLYGHVVDFIDLRVWPVFNLADSAITIGACLTAIGLLRFKERT